MRRLFIAFLVTVFCINLAHASETRILKTGDVIELEEGEVLSVAEFRKILRSYGYTRVGAGGRYGRIMVITARGADKNRYELKANSYTGELVRVKIKYSYRHD